MVIQNTLQKQAFAFNDLVLPTAGSSTDDELHILFERHDLCHEQRYICDSLGIVKSEHFFMIEATDVEKLCVPVVSKKLFVQLLIDYVQQHGTTDAHKRRRLD